MLSRIAIVAAVALATLTTGVQAGTRLPSQLRDVVSSPSSVSSAAQEALVARGYSMPWASATAPMEGTFGVDVSSSVSKADFECMKGKGYKFAIVRIFEEVCEVDSHGRATVENAWAGGMEHVDVYLFPSYGCRDNAATQVDRAISAMGSTKFGTLWLDIETGGQRSAAENMAWLKEAVAQAKAKLGEKRVGIYSSQYEWGLVMGNQRGPTELPVWFADYDGKPTLSNFREFGGWTRASMKQFAGDAKMCNCDVDLNWY